MSLEHVRIKEEVEWPDEGSSGFEAATVSMYEGLQPKIEGELDLKSPKHEGCDMPEASLCKCEAVEDNDFENLTSQVHVKDEVGSEMGVSEAAALAGLYNGCLVKEEMVIGPELVQGRGSPYCSDNALTLAVPEASLCKCEAVEDNHFENLTSQVHVKDEAGSVMGVSEAAALAGLYNGCLVKEEMVIGPELVQGRGSPYCSDNALTLAVPEASLCKCEAVEDNHFENLTSQVHVKDEAGSVMGVSEAAALAGLYNGCLVKEEMVIGPELVQGRGSPYCSDNALTLADLDFQEASNLKYFKQKTPEPDEPFSCKTCLKKAKHRDKKTIQHKRLHTGRTFNCQTCQFINEKYLDFHIKLHTGERPYVCEVCDKKFAKKDDLVEHRQDRRLHEPFTCPICNKKFWRRAYLNEHKKIHTNEKLFICE